MANRTRPQRDGPGRHDETGRWPELLQIAATTFAERGYQSTSLQDIADRFGVLKGSLYHYIRSKDDLLYEVVRTVFAGGLANLHRLAGADDDHATKLRAVVRGHVLYLIENLVGTTVFLHEFAHLSEERRRSMPVDEYAEVLTGLIRDAQRAGAVRADVDPDLSALALLGATNWVYRWYRPDGGRSPAEIADQYAHVLVDGMLAGRALPNGGLGE